MTPLAQMDAEEAALEAAIIKAKRRLREIREEKKLTRLQQIVKEVVVEYCPNCGAQHGRGGFCPICGRRY